MPDTLPETYKVWAWRSGAEPLDLRLEERPLPTPGPGEVLVRNHVVGLNPVDWKILDGSLIPLTAGQVPGVDGAGTVVALGAGVDTARLGQRVAYHQNLRSHGSFAEYTPIRASVLMRVPPGLDFTVAATFPCPAMTAWLALEKLPIRFGAQLLVSGAGGAVGGYLVQKAVKRGWTVTTLSDPRHWERLRDFGATTTLPWSAAEGDAIGPFTAVIDTVGPDFAGRLAPLLRANGHLVCIQGRVPDWPNEPFGRALSLHEVALGALHRHGDAEDWAHLTLAGEQLLAAIAEGRLRPEPTVERPFNELPRLLDELRHRAFTGKPVARILPD
ncbi:MAG: zinc-binding dehydrogenase [Azospirillaceae bacterium]|nr:zinc-binding dehydrogenase [Azospirillaceae bacterium]